MLTDIPELEKRNRQFEGGKASFTKDVFRFDKVIGSGSFGKVFRAISKSTGNSYAIKTISKSFIKNLMLADQLKNEIKILINCDHENIVKVFGCTEDAESIYVVMELAEDSLFKRLVSLKKFSEPQAAEILTQILKALHYLHSLTPPVLHRDLKPENVLCIRSRYVLADFGWSNIDNNLRNTFCGTPDYLAPEMINGKGHNDRLDIWTVGVLMYELLVGRPPFSCKEKIANKRLYQKIIEKNILEMNFEIPPDLSSEAVACLRKLLSVDPISRPSARETFELDFFKKAPRSLSQRQFSRSNLASKADLDVDTLLQSNHQLKAKLDAASREIERLKGEISSQQKGEVEVLRKSFENLRCDNEKLLHEVQILKAKSVKDEDIKHYLFEKGKQIATFVSEFHHKNVESSLNVTMDNVLSYENTLGKLEIIFRDFLQLKGKDPEIINETLPAFDINESKVNFGIKYGTALAPNTMPRISASEQNFKKIFNPPISK